MRALGDGEKNCLRIHARDDSDFSEPLSAARSTRKAMSLETRDDRLKMITENELFASNGDELYAPPATNIHCHGTLSINWPSLAIFVRAQDVTVCKCDLIETRDVYTKFSEFDKFNQYLQLF